MVSPAPVAVIIPAYNAAATLPDTLASIFAQTCPPAEVIVVDDGSRDATLATARAHTPPPGVTLQVISQPNSGVSTARNRGIQSTQQPFVAFLDADDLWVPTKLEEALTAFQNPHLVCLATNFIRLSGTRHIPVDATRNARRATPFLAALFLRNFICTSSVVLRTRILETTGLFPTSLRYIEDYDLWLRIAAAYPQGVQVLPSASTIWRDHPGSLSKKHLGFYIVTLRVLARHLGHLAAQTPWAPVLAFYRVGLLTVALAQGLWSAWRRH